MRAPIPAIQGTLIPHSFSEQYGTRHRAAQHSAFGRAVDFREMAVSQERNLREGRRNGMGRERGGRALLMDDEGGVSSAEPSTSSESRSSTKQRGENAGNLQQLYKQPTDIMFQADWDTVGCE